MYLPSALAASFLAATAHAFLVPLEVAAAAEQEKADVKVVDLDCPGCPFFDGDAQTDAPNKIHLEISVDASRELTINGHRLVEPTIVFASQLRTSDAHLSEPLPLSLAYERLDRVQSGDESDQELLNSHLTILAINGFPVRVDTVTLRTLTTPDGAFIADVGTVPFSETPGAVECENSSTWSLCRLRALVAARLYGMVNKAKNGASQTKSWFAGKPGCRGHRFGPPGPFGHGPFGPKHGGDEHMHHGRPHGHGHGHGHGHHHWGHHRFAHRFGRMLHQTLRFFVIPALLGVIGGLITSAVGMMVGQFICYLWLRFYRKENRRMRDVGVVEIVVEDGEDDEKVALMAADIDEPPMYTDLEADAAADATEAKN